MAETKNCNNLNEAVCIQTDKIYDSCREKECLENLRVYFSEGAQSVIDRATSVRFKRAEIICCSSDVEEVGFNRGFFSVDIKFYFKIVLEACGCGGRPIEIEGLATYYKKVILFGSEGSAFTFTSDMDASFCDCMKPEKNNLPKAVIETVNPVALGAKIVDVCCDCYNGEDSVGSAGCGCCDINDIPDSISNLFDGPVGNFECKKRIYVTLGIFVIVRLQRSVQLLIPCYDFCIPEKECIQQPEDDPCKLFEKIQFPVDEFFPPSNFTAQNDCDCGCGCK